MKQPSGLPEWIDPKGSTIPAYIRKAKYLAKQVEDTKYKVTLPQEPKEFPQPETKPEVLVKENVSSPEKKVDSENDIFQKILGEADGVKVRKNKEGKLITKDGSISNLQDELYWKIARTPSFKKWFSGSVACYNNGEPKVVYHASLAKSFDISKGVNLPSHAQAWQQSDIEQQSHVGIFFTSDRDEAVRWFKDRYETYTDKEHSTSEQTEEFLKENESQIRVFPAFIRLKKPFIEKGFLGQTERNGLSVSIMDFNMRRMEGKEAFMEQLNKNNDGLYLPESSDFGDEYSVIKDENIFILPSAI